MTSEELERLQADFFQRASKQGDHCPCCTRWGKFNVYVINGPKTAAFGWMAKTYGRETFWLPDSSLFSSITYFKNWDLLEKSVRPDDDEASERDRYWQLTKRGFNWYRGKLRVQQRVVVYDDRRLKFLDENDKISFSEGLLKGGFDLEQVMRMTAEMDPAEFEGAVKELFEAYKERKRKAKRKKGAK